MAKTPEEKIAETIDILDSILTVQQYPTLMLQFENGTELADFDMAFLRGRAVYYSRTIQ